jgi:HAD superfamily hydrolase (TIGR01484 family)
MRYLALACDYDGTLATHGRVTQATIAALERLRSSGRKLILVTGRQLPDLQTVFAHLELFEWVVAENGAIMYEPGSHQEKVLADAPLPSFVQALEGLGVKPLSVGRCIVATWHPHEAAILDVIREQGLELQIIFNKDAVMVLPTGVNKATGLAAVLSELGLSDHNIVGIGDAENDHAFLELCECAVAVANALPALKKHADFITHGSHGDGVAELIDQLVVDDLAPLEGRLRRHYVHLGQDRAEKDVSLPPYGVNVLIAGPSGSGKSTVATALLERLADARYQFCVVDPEGDYEAFEETVALGTHERGPSTEEVLKLLQNPKQSAVVNLVGMPIADRPAFFLALLPRLADLRIRLGRPHWLIVDEAHHLLPTSWPAADSMLRQLAPLMLITVHPDQVSPAALDLVTTAIAVGASPAATLAEFAHALNLAPPAAAEAPDAAEVLAWFRNESQSAVPVLPTRGRAERRRHTRKYAEGELPPERSFFFRGPQGKLNLRAQNLMLFLQLADGVDDDTWRYHLSQGDYSKWFRDKIKDDGLAVEAEQIEIRPQAPAADTRRLIREAIERRYTVSATPPLHLPGTDTEKS